MIPFEHDPVLLHETIDLLNIRPDGIYADLTAGGGGHSLEIAKRLTSGKLFSFDRDEEAVKASTERLAAFSDRCTVIHANYSDAAEILAGMGVSGLDGVTADLGVSSHQLDDADRGFSYMLDGALDMRMDRSEGLSAFDVVNGYDAKRLERVIFEYGEERFARQIVSAIIKRREEKKIEGTLELAEIIKNAIPPKAREGGHHPAKRTFQAIRIEVNGEIELIEPAIRSLAAMMNPGGRMAVISFHSLEDRKVKSTFADLASGCICPPDFPVCVCGRKPSVRIITKKAVVPSGRELEANPRSRSAKLRACEKI